MREHNVSQHWVPTHLSLPLCRVLAQVVEHHDLHSSIKGHTTHSKMCMLNKSNGIITVRAFNRAVFDPLLSDILAFQSCLRRLGAGPRTLLIRIAGNANFYNNRTFLLVIPHACHRRSVDQDSTNTISQGSLPNHARVSMYHNNFTRPRPSSAYILICHLRPIRALHPCQRGCAQTHATLDGAKSSA